MLIANSHLFKYLGCDCNYDLCSSQRSGQYEKWKWFDLLLYEAINKLSYKETGSFPVFSGLGGVKMNTKLVYSGYFVTYTSTSWRKEVSQGFMGGNEGMIIEICKEYKDDRYVFCCDVSWISKFKDECEILFARSLPMDEAGNNFRCQVIDESNGVQTISLKKNDD